MSDELQKLFEEGNLCQESLTECSECEGERVIKETFYLLRICKKCRGLGLLDWIDNAIGESKLELERTRDIESSIVRSNVSRLISLITEEYARFGEMVNIEIKHISTQHHPSDHQYFNRRKYTKEILDNVCNRKEI